MELIKSKKVWLIAGSLLIFLIGIGIGNSSAKVKLGKEKVKYDEVVGNIKTKENLLAITENKIEDKAKELTKIQDEVRKNKNEFDEAKKIIANKTNYQNEVNTLQSQITSKQNEVTTINAEIESKKGELASVTGQIKEKADAPKQLSAGKFIVGKDIPADRYKVTPVGRGSNFVVYDSTGSILEHTIISSVPDHGVPEYIVFLEDGYILENSSPFKFTPIE